MRKPLRSGDLNRRVTIERVTLSDNDSGGQTESWAPLTTVWAKATPVAGKESLAAGTLHAAQPWRIEMRFSEDLTTGDRLSASWLPANHRINIASVADPDGLRERIVVFGTAVQAFDLAAD